MSVPRGLTVLAAIRRGEEASLRDTLRAIGDDIRGKSLRAGIGRPHVDFARSRSIHFARFAILRDPERGPAAARLLFSSNYDGTLENHIAELIDLTSDMDAIWGRCDGYEGVAAFPAFIRARAHEPAAFYIAFRDQSVETIRRACVLRSHLRELLESNPTAAAATLRTQGAAGGFGAWWARVSERLRTAIERSVRGAPVLADFIRAVRRDGARTVVSAAKKIIATLDRYPVFRFVNRLTGNRLPPRKSVFSSVALDNCAPPQPRADGDEIPPAFPTPPTFREDVITQNQLTLVTVVNPQQVHRVKAVMASIDSYAKRLAPAGSLIGISTIHFVRWLLVDDDRRLIMLSDYDGSWENYIDEFAEMILSGLDAIWESSFGFPPDGARDLPAFKRFLRAHQVPAEVFFSAYPDQTVLNLSNNLKLARAIESASTPLTELLPTL